MSLATYDDGLDEFIDNVLQREAEIERVPYHRPQGDVRSVELPDLTQEQQDALDIALTLSRQRRITTIGGLAGTGKTVLVAHAIRRLRSCRVAVVAPTWKAAMVLRAKGIPATSVHALIYGKPREYEDARGRACLDFSESLRPENAAKADIVVVDEASMLSGKLLEDLQKLVPTLILVGDHGQLEPVENDGAANPIFNPDVRLETVHRNAGEIAHFAFHLRSGRRAREWVSTTGAVRLVPHIDDSILRNLRDPEWQLIVATNASRQRLNAKARHIHGRHPELAEKGDRVISLSNRQGVYNGETWLLEWISAEDGRAELRRIGDPRLRNVSYAGLPRLEPPVDERAVVKLDYAYAITCHKAQGSEWPHVVVIEAPRIPGWTHERWTYTAATRAKRSLWWVAR